MVALLISLNNLSKQERGSVDYHVDNNSGIAVVKWLDNSIFHLVSYCINVEMIGTIDGWCNKSQVGKAVPCPKIVSIYNKSMGGMDLADMLITLYRREVKTCHWYITVFWHFVGVAKANTRDTINS